MQWFERSVALTPSGGGGLCIGQDTLQPADIIVSTTRAFASEAIRFDTHSPVSHAALYAGNGEVVEALTQGVVRHTLPVALADDVLAVAYRSPQMTGEIADRIVAYAASQLGRPYNFLGALLSTRPILCHLSGSQPASFFCSQLVFEAYRRGGLPLTNLPSGCVTPAAAVEIAQDRLAYLGHLLGSPSLFPTIFP
jgi:cell wall-associated NlpC family hydrolase